MTVKTALAQDEDPMCAHCDQRATHYLVYEGEFRKLIERHFCSEHLNMVISNRPFNTYEVEKIA